jgi:HlyD family secretion protein
MNESEPQPAAKADAQPEAKAKTPSDPTPQIAERAYELYEERGRQRDPAVRDWEQAKQEIVKETANAGTPPGAESESKPEIKTAPVSSTKKKVLVVGVLVFAIAAALAIGFGLGRWWGRSKAEPSGLVLYGNVDLRQIELAFNNSERIAEVLVQEGDKVTHGQTLARLDTSRLKPQVAEAEAELAAQQAVVERLHHGSRPEEIAQARANVVSAKANLLNADQQWRRLTALAGLTAGRAISQQDLDNSKAALDMAQARLAVEERSLELSTIGPRAEDVAQGEAQLRANQAQLELLRRKLADADLVAPCDAVVRSRLLEPGEMISPQRPVFDLAITDPKWIRAYVSETDLGKVHPGMKASVSSDSFPGQTLRGWVGFISSVAEFTPKSVESEELRSSLVYEIRVFVQDPQDEMRLGMPATVSLELNPPARSKP